MDHEVELVSDGDGLAVIGDAMVVDLFLSSAGVVSKDLALQRRLGPALGAGAGIAQAGSDVAANAGRWVKLTEESAKALKVGQLMKGSSSGIRRAVVTDKGKITGILEIVKTPASMLANPAVLAGAAGIMAQLAMQQTMQEITDYLEAIDEKLDDVLRAQKDAALAQLIGVGAVVDEALTIRDHVGGVSEVTWSKVQGTALTIAQAQAYALLQLDALAKKMEKKSKVGDLAEVAKEAEVTVAEWLAVLARCFQLQDAIAVLELDRLLDVKPEELDRHRVALQGARQRRREQIARSSETLLARMDTAAAVANGQVLLHPLQSGAVVQSSNRVASDIALFNERLGIDGRRQELEAKRWTAAAGEVREKARETGADGLDAARRFGSKALVKAKTTSAKLSVDVPQHAIRLRRNKRGSQDQEQEPS